MARDPVERRNELRAVAKAIAREVGADAMRALHREDRRLDGLTVVVLWALIVLVGAALGVLPVGPLWTALFVLQGFALLGLGFCAHDLFIHRRVGGARWSLPLANLCLFPLAITASDYAASHLDHHFYLGTDRDGESYKEDLDRRWVKLLLLVGPLVPLVLARLFRRRDQSVVLPAPPERTPEQVRRARREGLQLLGFLLGVGVALCLWPRLVLCGYVLPALVTLPLASAVRLVLEHGESDPQNPYHAATCYQPGPLLGALFLWSVGDAHLIHHLFPHIPYYRLGEARRAMLPILLRAGVVQRRSLLWLLHGWFVHNRRHATVWPGQG